MEQNPLPNLTESWLSGHDGSRRVAVAELLKLAASHPDPEIQVKAFAAVVTADKADLRRVEIAHKQREANERRKLQLLAIIRSLPPGEIAKLASDYKAASDGGLSGEAAGADGYETGGRT